MRTPIINSILGVEELENIDGNVYLNRDQLNLIETTLNSQDEEIKKQSNKLHQEEKKASEFEESIIDFCKKCKGAEYSEFDSHFTLSIPLDYWNQLLKDEEFKNSFKGRGFRVSQGNLIINHDDIKLFV